jgi:hypothetical protein
VLNQSLVQARSEAVQQVELVNLNNVDVCWKLKRTSGEQILQCEPSEGFLKSGERCAIQLRVFSQVPIPKWRSLVKCTVDGCSASHLLVKADIQQPKILVSPVLLHIPVTYLDIPTTQAITLQNNTSLTTSFLWQNEENQGKFYCFFFFFFLLFL